MKQQHRLNVQRSVTFEAKHPLSSFCMHQKMDKYTLVHIQGNPFLKNLVARKRGNPHPPLCDVANFRQNPMTSHFATPLGMDILKSHVSGQSLLHCLRNPRDDVAHFSQRPHTIDHKGCCLIRAHAVHAPCILLGIVYYPDRERLSIFPTELGLSWLLWMQDSYSPIGGPLVACLLCCALGIGVKGGPTLLGTSIF